METPGRADVDMAFVDRDGAAVGLFHISSSSCGSLRNVVSYEEIRFGGGPHRPP